MEYKNNRKFKSKYKKKNRKPPVYCGNCGKCGHIYRECNEPIISVGIILYREKYKI